VAHALLRLGFVREEGGRHTGFHDPRGVHGKVVIPRHSRVNRYLLRGALKRAGVSEDEFMTAY
jgi:predicted RNA binding protein YcfA (HicA-like mRNA interferase family)